MNNTHIIGFCGRAGCGKGTVSEIIVQSCPHVGVFPMAAELKRIAKEEFGWDGLKDDKGRKLLQILGTDCGRMYGGNNFWVEKWKEKVDSWLSSLEHIRFRESWSDDLEPIVICDDVRFDNEAQTIKDLGGKIVQIVGRSYDMGENNNHTSEAGIDVDLIDYVLCNTDSMKDLERSVAYLLTQLGIKHE